MAVMVFKKLDIGKQLSKMFAEFFNEVDAGEGLSFGYIKRYHASQTTVRAPP